ncbi:hypothetical protein DSOL_4691 [Desulfosporosinus metallidurans]|uniref:Uncharacterized protein n=1 Tax=Desulfosporosinus metallidurans TaxID=1888891 RepID=A0A1Q8QIK7_9FIRM|nr:hypothetical protein DSOL_4691 [Desulfosporosinus metallidurans]
MTEEQLPDIVSCNTGQKARGLVHMKLRSNGQTLSGRKHMPP